jgi:hypothetical protein
MIEGSLLDFFRAMNKAEQELRKSSLARLTRRVGDPKQVARELKQLSWGMLAGADADLVTMAEALIDVCRAVVAFGDEQASDTLQDWR